jgi:phenylpyruvate tautomerase PptA (4-oxalocrotonate tautomerase family)/heme-degrading monooxygenase HmoA
MPFVHIIMEPRDEESKHRISREVSDAVAEGTNNSIDGITVIFHEVPRSGYARGLSYSAKRPRPPRSAATGRPEYVAVNRMWIEDEEAYVALRRDLVNPALANQEGFVSTQLLRLSGTDHEYLMINKWMTRAHHEAWLASQTHISMEDDARRRVPGRKLIERLNGELVHQTFGPMGGVVQDAKNGAGSDLAGMVAPATPG